MAEAVSARLSERRTLERAAGKSSVSH